MRLAIVWALAICLLRKSLIEKAGQKNAVPGIYAGQFLDTQDIEGTFPNGACIDLQRKFVWE